MKLPTRSVRVVLGACVIAGGAALVTAGPATAACHIFTISATSVTEGAAVTVTVQRDNSVADSSIRVTSEDGTAKAPGDYAAVDKTVSFTGNSTQESFQVATVNDAAAEQAENFTLKMSNPGGCAVNPNFDFSDTATATINDNDQIAPAPTTTSKPIANPTTTKKPTTTTAGVTTTAAGVTTTTSAPSKTTLDSTTTSSTLDVELASDDDDSPVMAIVLGLAALAALGAVGYVLYRRRAAT